MAYCLVHNFHFPTWIERPVFQVSPGQSVPLGFFLRSFQKSTFGDNWYRWYCGPDVTQPTVSELWGELIPLISTSSSLHLPPDICQLSDASTIGGSTVRLCKIISLDLSKMCLSLYTCLSLRSWCFCLCWLIFENHSQTYGCEFLEVSKPSTENSR